MTSHLNKAADINTRLDVQNTHNDYGKSYEDYKSIDRGICGYFRRICATAYVYHIRVRCLILRYVTHGWYQRQSVCPDLYIYMYNDIYILLGTYSCASVKLHIIIVKHNVRVSIYKETNIYKLYFNLLIFKTKVNYAKYLSKLMDHVI